MVANTDAGARLISDIGFLTQRASGETCEIAARMIERQTSRYLAKYPGGIKDADTFQLTSGKLCECILLLRDIVAGAGEEILANRQELDLLLALNSELEYIPHGHAEANIDPVTKFARSA